MIFIAVPLGTSATLGLCRGPAPYRRPGEAACSTAGAVPLRCGNLRIAAVRNAFLFFFAPLRSLRTNVQSISDISRYLASKMLCRTIGTISSSFQNTWPKNCHGTSAEDWLRISCFGLPVQLCKKSQTLREGRFVQDGKSMRSV